MQLRTLYQIGQPPINKQTNKLVKNKQEEYKMTRTHYEEFKSNLNKVLKVLPYIFNLSEFSGFEYDNVIANYETGEVTTGDLGDNRDDHEIDWIKVWNTELENYKSETLKDIKTYLTDGYKEYHGIEK